MDWVKTSIHAVMVVTGTAVIFGSYPASGESIFPTLDLLLSRDFEHDPRATFKVVDKDD